MFICKNCGVSVDQNPLGSMHRNHCPKCLHSLHLDTFPGDRKSSCHGVMEPIGLTFKRYKKGEAGELMLVHKCKKCGALSKNRLAGDDVESAVVDLYTKTKESVEKTMVVDGTQVRLLDGSDEREIMTQLYGKNFIA